MIIHIDTQRDPEAPQDRGRWIAIQTQILGYDLRERVIKIEDQPERILAVAVNVGHAARAIEQNGFLRNNKIILQDDRDSVTANREQFEVFEMLSDKRKKLLTALGGNYEKYFRAIIQLKYYWQIVFGLWSDRQCVNKRCKMPLEAFQPKCGFCGTRHEIKWK